MNTPSDNLLDIPKSVPLRWQAFESEVADYISNMLDGQKWGLDKNLTRVTRKRKLYSRDRSSDIVFDVVVEVFASSNSYNPLLIWLWECKDYPSRRVTVEEVEEFHCKKMQVGAHKGTMVTRCGFQEGAIRFAKSNRMGLMTLTKQKVSTFAMSRDADSEHNEIVGSFCLYTFGLEIGDSSNSSGPWLRTMINFEISKLGNPDHGA